MSFNQSTLYSARAIDLQKADTQLALAIKKATSPIETAPKQKHVRKCIVYTWDYKSSKMFWMQMKNQPLYEDEVQAFKALITIHKVIRQGHPAVLPEAIEERGFFDTLLRHIIYDSYRGYADLITGYIDFLRAKLEYHRIHPKFNGSFNYEEYATLHETINPDEGYETISELMVLQDKLDSFQKKIFSLLRMTVSNECRISALVPLVEESHAIYVFLISMLRAMHKRVGSIDALQPLRDKFNKQHENLVNFYSECRNLRYLTSLITIPTLARTPPNLYEADDEVEVAVVQKPDIPDEADSIEEEADGSRALVTQPSSELPVVPSPDWVQTQLQQAQMLLRNQQEQIKALVQQNEQLTGTGQHHLKQYRDQIERDQIMLQNYDGRVKQLEQQLSQLHLMNQSVGSKDSLIQQLQLELAKLKEKYDKLAKLYAELRTEHLSVLERMKDLRKRAQSAANFEEQLKKLQQTLKAKQNEIMTMMRDRDKYKNELTCTQDTYNENMGRLRRELEHTKDRLEHLGRSKGAETSDMIRKFNAEKSELEQLSKDKADLADQFRKDLEVLKDEFDTYKESKEEEVAVYQAGMDQSLLALQQLKNQTESGNESLSKKIRDLEGDHASQLDMILDNILANCVAKVEESVYELESQASPGDTNASPEIVLSMIEKTHLSSDSFGKGFKKFLSPGCDQTAAITTAYEFANTVGQLIHNTKGITRLAQDDQQFLQELLNATRKAAVASRVFFIDMQSANLGIIPTQQRPGHVDRHTSTVHTALSEMAQLTERLVFSSSSRRNPEEDLEHAIESEMRQAARAIEEATCRLERIIQNRPPSEDEWTFSVHGSILEASMAIMNAIANLIRRATEAQQEIVAEGRGGLTKKEFYKKNNRWTEGLISASKAVAVTAQMLVETADGVVHGTHKMKQLVVAAHEVSGATAQLVAASRVKAKFGSRTQERLEQAARAVSDATRALVEAARRVAKDETEDKSVDYRQLSLHDLKVAEMEHKVRILELEQALQAQRAKLAELRRATYHQ